MYIQFNQGEVSHVISELAVGLKLSEKVVQVSIPKAEGPLTVRFTLDTEAGFPPTFVTLRYKDIDLDPNKTGSGSFLYDPQERTHTLTLEFDSSSIPEPQNDDDADDDDDLPEWEGTIIFQIEEDTSKTENWYYIQVNKFLVNETLKGVFSIDLGTTNSSVAFWEAIPEPVFTPNSPILLDETKSVPSAIYVNRNFASLFKKQLDPKSYDVGQKAIDGEMGECRFTSIKRGIGTKKKYEIPGRRKIRVPVRHMMKALAKKIIEDAQSTLGKSVAEIVVTSPPRWDAVSIGELHQVLVDLGFPADRIDMSTDEASAAGLYYVLSPILEHFGRPQALNEYLSQEYGEMKVGTNDEYRFNLLSMDFGGGTTDLALICVHLSREPETIVIDINIADRSGLNNVGGDNLTLYLFRLLKRRLALALAHPQKFLDPSFSETPTGNPWIDHFAFEPQQSILVTKWDAVIEHLDDFVLPNELWQAVNGVFPTANRGDNAHEEEAATGHFNWLWAQADQLKKALCVEVNAATKNQDLSLERISNFDNWGVVDLDSFKTPLLSDSIPLARENDEFREKLGVRFGHICRFSEAVIADLVELALRMEDRSREIRPDFAESIQRVVLAGNGARNPYVAAAIHKPRADGGLGISQNQIKFDPENAKLAVPVGACLKRIARKVDGFKISVQLNRTILPFEIYFKHAAAVVLLFSRGRIDEFFFFQRGGISDTVTSEYLARLADSDSETEEYRDIAQFVPTEEGISFVDFESDKASNSGFWKTLKRDYRLKVIPNASDFVSDFSVYHKDDSDSGQNRITSNNPKEIFASVRDKSYSMGEMLEILRNELSMVQKISWIEQAFLEPLADGEIFHRYYLDLSKQLYLVRHHWDEGKKLLRPKIPASALVELNDKDDPFSGIH